MPELYEEVYVWDYHTGRRFFRGTVMDTPGHSGIPFFCVRLDTGVNWLAREEELFTEEGAARYALLQAAGVQDD